MLVNTTGDLLSGNREVTKLVTPHANNFNSQPTISAKHLSVQLKINDPVRMSDSWVILV